MKTCRTARRRRTVAAVALATMFAPAAVDAPEILAHGGPGAGVTIRGSPDDTPDQTEPPGPPDDPDATSVSDSSTGPLLPETVEFPVTEAFGTSIEQLDLVNASGGPVDISDVMVNGPDFDLLDENCTEATLADGDSCGISIRFAPTDVGESIGGLSAVVNGATEVTTLQGTGVDAPATTESVPETAVPTTDSVNPPTTVPDEPEDDLAARTLECERRARRAEVRYPDSIEMTVGRESSVAVNVTLEGSPPPSEAEAPSDTVVDEAVLTCFVVAVLSGSNFEIDPASQTGDFVLSPTIDWTWDVVPQTTGRHDLDLRIIPRIGSGSAATEGTPRTFRADITVFAEPRSSWEALSDFLADLVQHPLFQLLVAAGVVSGVGAAVRRRFGSALARRRDERSEEDSHKSGYL